MWLNESEIERLTGKKQAKKQMLVLSGMNVPFTVSGDGKPLVIESVFTMKARRSKDSQPNFEAIHGAVA